MSSCLTKRTKRLASPDGSFANRLASALRNPHSTAEEGFTLVELLIAITILAIVVMFSSTGFVNSFRTAASMENRSKALQIGNDVVAIAEQAPYRRAYTPRMASSAELTNATGAADSDKCDVDPRLVIADPSKFGGLMVLPPDDYSADPSWEQYREFKGLVYCQKRYFGQENAEQVGVTFYVQTDIIYSNLETSDSPTRAEAGGTPASENTKGKRVVVTVKWKDTLGGESKVNTVTLQRVILPNAWDCPVGYVTPPTTSGGSNATTNGLLGC